MEVIILREISSTTANNISSIKLKKGIKTNTKAVIFAIDEYSKSQIEVEELKKKIRKLEDEIFDKNQKLKVIKDFFNVIKKI